jgi:hypothetical protein
LLCALKNINKWEVNPTLNRKEITLKSFQIKELDDASRSEITTPELGKQLINQVPADTKQNEFLSIL